MECFTNCAAAIFHGSNLLSIITKSLYGEWSQWENTISGRRGKAYEEKKLSMANSFLQKAKEIFWRLERCSNSGYIYFLLLSGIM